MFFDSLEKTLRVVRDENLEEEEEEESESVVAGERACVATYAILKDHVFDKWKQVSQTRTSSECFRVRAPKDVSLT